MNKVVIILSTFCLFVLLSCSKSNRCDELVCTDSCVFVEINRPATVHFYGCYIVWGAQFTNDANEVVIGLAPDMPLEYKEEGKEITFSGTFYENDLPLAIPDPMAGSFYRMEICSMNGDSN